MSVEQQLREFINETFLFGQGVEHLANEDSFLERGIIDSTGILELIHFLEDQYQLKLADRDLVPENLDSIGRLTRFIDRQKSAEAVVEPAACS